MIAPEIIPLGAGAANALNGVWPDRVVEVVSRGELHAYRVAKPLGRVLVCAGGGYVRLMYDREGAQVAEWLNGLGYEADVLVHRLPGQADGAGGVWPKDVALTDALAALGHIPRDQPLFLLGLSSGGHLAGAVACQPGVDANGLLIAYGPINANHSRYKAPPGKPDYPPPQKQAFYDDWPIGLAAEPHGVPRCPAFLAYALHDQSVPIEHALNYIRTARDLDLDLDAHVFGKAPHGFALRELEGSQAAWPDLAALWMARKASR
ncbi:prolyl oligopeptidase family serine peptidase [Caulobacter sp. 1776]|uniref:alpha/beta hydrolase n=1 Tax=Caulobacter sp. 1776 TaxID=3156420 RepID=UPI003397EE84